MDSLFLFGLVAGFAIAAALFFGTQAHFERRS
jgi:hypothetical protein